MFGRRCDNNHSFAPLVLTAFKENAFEKMTHSFLENLDSLLLENFEKIKESRCICLHKPHSIWHIR